MDPRHALLCSTILLAACADPGGGGSTGTDTGDASTDVTDVTEPTDGAAEPTTGASTGDLPPPEPDAFWLLEDVVFYDGYAETVDEPVPEGVIRHNNALVATPLTEAYLARIQNTLRIGVIVGALCDNYDRIGAVNLAMVPKGAATYVPADVDRIEVARFITPFMDMNKSPKEVPYEWQADHLVPILKDPELLAGHDFWFELSIFGVPYAANEEVAGCAGRNDTQLGSLGFRTSSDTPAQAFSVLLPLAINEDFNNYTD